MILYYSYKKYKRDYKKEKTNKKTIKRLLVVIYLFVNVLYCLWERKNMDFFILNIVVDTS